MTGYQFDGNFLYYVRLLKKLYEDTLSAAAKELGLSFPEADVLCFLRENPEFDTASDVALYRDVSRAYVSKAVELLAAKGYLAIRQDADDRRYQHLLIADRARAAAEALHQAQYQFYHVVTADLSDTEITALLALIKKCAISVEAASKAGPQNA